MQAQKTTPCTAAAAGRHGGAGGRVAAAAPRLAARPRAAAHAAVLLAATFLLAACSGSGGGSTAPSPSGPVASTPGTQATATRTPARPAAITVSSTAFAEGAPIPARFSCRGGNTPPPLTWTGIPSAASSIAVVMDDPDAVGGTYTHWVVFNLPATTSGITGSSLPAGAAQARNSGGHATYLGPCPPSGTHHYRFTVYAEPQRLPLAAGGSLAEALRAITAHPLASGRLTGLFSG